MNNLYHKPKYSITGGCKRKQLLSHILSQLTHFHILQTYFSNAITIALNVKYKKYTLKITALNLPLYEAGLIHFNSFYVPQNFYIIFLYPSPQIKYSVIIIFTLILIPPKCKHTETGFIPTFTPWPTSSSRL